MTDLSPEGKGKPRRPGARRGAPKREVLHSLQERAKELSCLYRVEEILNEPGLELETAMERVIAAVPPGLQYSEVCQVLIRLDGRDHALPGYRPGSACLSAPLRRGGAVVGDIEICYTEQMPEADRGPFLQDEVRLVNAIADRLSLFLELQAPAAGSERWVGALRLLRDTNRDLYARLARRMIRHLHWMGVDEAREALNRTGHREATDWASGPESDNRPGRKTSWDEAYYVSDEPFQLAARHLGGEEILQLVHTWMVEEKTTLLARIVNNRQTSLVDISKALRRAKELEDDEGNLSTATQKGIVVSLIRRFLSDDLDFIAKAKNNVKPTDFLEITEKAVFSRDSRGRIGGKSTGLFVAGRILEAEKELLRGDFEVKTPHSWYVASECLVDLMEYNDLHDWSLEQKYKDLDQVRREYPILVQLFKHARFPSELANGLSMALDDLSNRPIIVRSSSLAEDRQGMAFSGKYKSLFLANQGPKKARLEALLDAIAETYASIFAPDPIEYRRERGLLDFDEEMAILLQEVVGTRSGRYYFPSFSGVAFSNNEFPWSSRISREDGLLRLVPGLGTRAVDRIGDDYPVLVAPGKPGLRANSSVEEKLRYAPSMIDAIDLEDGCFKTLPVKTLLTQAGWSYPGFRLLFSVFDEDRLLPPSRLRTYPADRMIVTFEGLLNETTFVKQMTAIMKVLEDRFGTAVDIEFACTPTEIFVLQCRAQSYATDEAPAPIPSHVPEQDVLFRGHKHISSGTVSEVEYLVYVDPSAYGELEHLPDLKAVGTAVGRLNQVLPARRFILMGPGRWGSRGDIKLGVSVTYSDINNTAMLVEIARKKGHYLPDLSFGTHFFQDLVESSIRYLPLYPDEEGGYLNEKLLLEADNELSTLAPEYSWLSKVIRVVNLPRISEGRRLCVAMNAGASEALGYLSEA